ncbi:GAF domain-containing sensor histidine kinase [Laspinema olomoucense]|uniref:GAF domain-containing sensor histidine kinase n=1 Tax=Laspinema olomoucense TaxID=3231600 RepID=UPI0021BA79E7|nr:GAF domain-containing protein [Laspinema sp. D3d]MCT7970748.1 GAF domain-containing protein [Laspinema sp. D3d]
MTFMLKKLYGKKEIRSAIDAFVTALDSPIAILDAGGAVIVGDPNANFSKYPVVVNGEVIGWVCGGEKVCAIASMISCLATQEVEKKALAREVLGKYRELTLLYNISEKIIGSLDIKEVAAIVLEEAQRGIKASSGVVMLWEEGSDRLESIEAFGPAGDCFSELGATATLLNRSVETGRGEIVNDIVWDLAPGAGQNEPPAITSVMCVPLKTKEKVIGAIAIGNIDSLGYTAEDLKLLSALASQAASAIAALAHENKLQESRRQAILFRLATQIRQSLELSSILETAVTEIRNLLRVDRCLFAWYKPAKSNIKSWESTEPSEIYPEQCAERSLPPHPDHLTHLVLPMSDYWQVINEAKHPALPSLIGDYGTSEVGGLASKLLQMEIVRVDDVTKLTDSVMRQFFLKQDVSSILAVPIETRLGKMGFVACANSSKIRPWSDDEIELLEAVGNQLAIAIDQAELYQQSLHSAEVAREKAEELEKTLVELQQTEAQLVQSEKMSGLGQLVAGIAHEINNPVNFIHGNLVHVNNYTLELLTVLNLYQKYYPEPVAELEAAIEEMDVEFLMDDLPKLLSSMKLGTDRIRSIVQSLRLFSRVDESDMKRANIRDGIESTLMILQHRLNAQPGRLPIQLIFEDGDLPLVECYPGQLNQVFMNLIANAIDALEEAMASGNGRESQTLPTLRIRTERVDFPPVDSDEEPLKNSASPRVRITIADNGIGMTESVRRRLFDPFFTTKAVGKGTGLGLSISYQIVVEKHRGTLECISEPNQGAEFIIELPIFQSPSQGNVSFFNRNSGVREAKSRVHHVQNC